MKRFKDLDPSKYKPLKLVMQKTPPLNRPSKYIYIYIEIALKYKVKQSKNGKFLPLIRLAKSILKRKFRSVDKPLRICAPPKISLEKGPFKNISPGAYFRNFTVTEMGNLGAF